MGMEYGIQNAVDGVKATVDGIKEAYKCPDGFAIARHILFLADGDEKRKASVLKKRIDEGELSFGQAAMLFSSCPTRDLNGSLGTFESLARLSEGTLSGDTLPYEGQDVTPFDRLVFSPRTPLGVVQTVTTQWGTHLVLVEARGARPAPADPTADAISQAADLVGQAFQSSPPPPGRPPTGGFGERAKRKKPTKRKRR